ncbi:hypothetical protein [Streptomyces solaniscabiei]|uniref:hypothetical protein n=1 Tax=Streptomyces solaniscabiei TaxID=2683255 RepID=UPI001CE3A4FD|nr:hypothetical protein [Streptomyces solaniscabiei]
MHAITRSRGPYVSCEAENLAAGGAVVTVSLPAVKAQALADHLDKLSFYEFIDVSGNLLRVEFAHDWTRFTFTGDTRGDEGPSGTVPVVVLTARLSEVARALRIQAEHAELLQSAREDRAQCSADAAIGHDGTGVCHHNPLDQAARPMSLSALLEHVAVRLPVADTDSIAVTVLAETLLDEDRPADELQAMAAARYLLAHHARELAEALCARAGRRGAPTYDYETGPGMHAAAERLAEYADRLDGGTGPAPVTGGHRYLL